MFDRMFDTAPPRGPIRRAGRFLRATRTVHAPVARHAFSMAILLLLLCGVAAAAEEAPKTVSPTPAEEAPPASDFIQSRITYVQGQEAIEAAQKEEIIAIYKDALSQLQAGDDWKSTATPFDDALENGPDQIERMQLDALEQPQPVRIDVPADATLLELSHRLLQTEEDLSLAQATRADIEQELAKRGDRRKELPNLILNARQRLRDLAPVTVPADAQEPDKSSFEARQTLAAAQRYSIATEAETLDKELQSFDIRGQLLKVQLDAAVLDIGRKENAVALWRDAVSARRQADARKAAEQARVAVMDAAKASPAVRTYAEKLAAENAALVERRNGPNGLIRRIDQVSETLHAIESALNTTKSEFATARQKAESLGSGNAVGLLLRQSKAHLPDLGDHRQALRGRQAEIAKIQTDRLNASEQRTGLANIEKTLREIVPPSKDPEVQKQQARLLASLRGLLKAKRDALDAIMDDYEAIFDKLVDADAKERQLVLEVEQFGQFIDERILWNRSGNLLGWEEINTAATLLKKLADPKRGQATIEAVYDELKERPLLDGMVAVALLLLIWLRRQLAGRLVKHGIQANKSSCTSLGPTVRAIGLTLLLAIPGPALLWVLGDRLGAAAAASDTIRIASTALKDVALVVLILFIVRETFYPGGLAETHLGWGKTTARSLRRHVGWLLVTTPALIFLMALLDGLGDEHWNESFGRFIFVALLGLFTLFAHALLRPARGPISQWYALRKGAKNRYRFILYTLGVATPLILGLSTGLGYFYTAHRLSVRLFETATLFAGVAVVRGCVSRWLLLARRRLAIEQLRAQRAYTRQAETDDDAVHDERPPELELGRIDRQMNGLIKSAALICLVAGTWAIWSRELPALRVLTSIEVWQSSESVSAPVATPATTPAPETNEKSATPAASSTTPSLMRPATSFTVGDLLVASVLALLTIVATRNVPGLLDLTMLKRTHYMRGERYAITMVVRYSIVVVGGVLTFHALGIGWAKVQWLIAALGVGIGFGLQEIFANFISGIIILVERPIRVGDVVTVGGISGTVSRIRIRATWITDATRKELIVPNKEFITNQVMNWTLSDSVLRVDVTVGISHDADVEQAETILRRIARENEHVLADPAPMVSFNGFGDSMLNFELRVYCDSVDAASPLQHSLNMAIHKAFREAGIAIAHPQRDIHIRSVTPELKAMSPSKTPENTQTEDKR